MKVKIKYRYFGLDYLGSDRDGDIYLLTHFRYRRTAWAKKLTPFLNGNSKSIKYHGSNISFNQLRKLKIEVDEEIEIH